MEIKKFDIIVEEKGFNLISYDFLGVSFKGKNLLNIILPQDKELFQKIKDKSLYYTQLPPLDYEYFNFKGVDLRGAIFPKNSSLPKNKKFFQTIKSKSLENTTLPSGDYKDYDFKGVNLNNTIFTYDSILPYDFDFIKKLKNSELNSKKLPEKFIKTIHMYNFTDARANLANYELSNMQILCIRKKHPNSKDIVFPELQKECFSFESKFF